MNKIDSFEQMDKSSGDYHKTKGWIEGLLKLPFGKYKNLPVSLKNTSEENIRVETNKAEGEKCPVCWKINIKSCERHKNQ